MMRMVLCTACLLLSVAGTWASGEAPDSTELKPESETSSARPSLPDRPDVPPEHPALPEKPDTESRLKEAMEAAQKAESQTEIYCLTWDGCIRFQYGDFEIPASDQDE
jgi:hypothetical protein